MASIFRRRKSLIFKLILIIPALWLFLIVVLAFQERLTFKSDPEGGNFVKREMKPKTAVVNVNPVVDMQHIIGVDSNIDANHLNTIHNSDGGGDKDIKVDTGDTHLKFNSKGVEPQDPDAPGEF